MMLHWNESTGVDAVTTSYLVVVTDETVLIEHPS
jgi:hypothetical protein